MLKRFRCVQIFIFNSTISGINLLASVCNYVTLQTRDWPDDFWRCKWMDAVAESERNPVSTVSTRISLSVENGQADAGQDGQTCLARQNSQACTEGITIFSCSAGHKQDWHQPCPLDQCSAESDIYDGIFVWCSIIVVVQLPFVQLSSWKSNNNNWMKSPQRAAC